MISGREALTLFRFSPLLDVRNAKMSRRKSERMGFDSWLILAALVLYVTALLALHIRRLTTERRSDQRLPVALSRGETQLIHDKGCNCEN